MNGYNQILGMVNGWQQEIADPVACGELKEILDHLNYLEDVKFQPYLPTLYSTRHPASFMERFHAWLNNPGLDGEEQRDLLRFAHQIAFFSFDDFAALFRSAFTGPVTRWCMDQAKIKLTASDWHQRLHLERHEKTWFCPVTDSLLISVFHHVNQIEGKDRKPSFRDLAEFGEAARIQEHMVKKGYERLVLLEDFVGTGTQSMKAVKWALRNLEVPVLFCPILISEEAVGKYRRLKEKLENGTLDDARCVDFTFEPVFTLSDDLFVYEQGKESAGLPKRIHNLAERIHARLSETNQCYEKGSLGYWMDDSPQKGAAVVMFSNTPNNSLPLIWHEAEGHWSPLFPRVARQPL